MFNYVTKQPYSGKNVQVLAEAGYAQPWFMTYNQAKQVGLTVRKGEHGTKICKIVLKEVVNPKTGVKEKKRVPKFYTVFNIAQCDEVVLEA